MARKQPPIDEAVSVGHEPAGTVSGALGALQAFGPNGECVGTFPTIAEARRALYQLHQDSQAALLAAQ